MDGNTPRKGRTIPDTSSTNASANAPAAALLSNKAQEARQRLESARSAAPREHAFTPRSLQDAFLDERNDVLAVINELEDQLDRQQEMRATLERQLATTGEQLHAANQRTQELEWQSVTLRTRAEGLEHLREEATAIEEALNDERTRAQRLTEQLAGIEQERTRLQAELKAAHKQVDEFWTTRKERDTLRADYKALAVRLEELERAQRELTTERANLHGQVEESRTALEQLTEERNQTVITQRGLEDHVRELSQVQAALEEKLEALRDEKRSLLARITHLERENTRLVDQRQFYECEVTALRNQNRTAEAALAGIKKAFGEVRVALTETRARAQRRAYDTGSRIGLPLSGIADARTGATPITRDAADVVPSLSSTELATAAEPT